MKNQNVAKPQADDGFTKISNSLLKYACSQPLTIREMKVLFCVLRYTSGFNRSKAELSLRFISKFTGIRFDNLSSIIKKMIQRRILIEYRLPGNDHTKRELGINENLGLWASNSSQLKNCSPSDSSQDKNSSVLNLRTETVLNLRTKKENNKENHKERRFNDLESEFDRFWSLYDKKTGKAKSWEQWKKLTSREKEDIFRRLPSYIEARPEKQFRKDPERYLKYRIWEDEYTGASEKEQAQEKLISI